MLIKSFSLTRTVFSFNLYKECVKFKLCSAKMTTITKVKLNNGLEMPAFGLGTYLGKAEEVYEAVKHAIDIGYRHIDTAFLYKNEQEVGKAIKDKIAEGAVKREDIFLTTKLWCHHHEPSRVEYACRKSLENLGLDYIDLYLIHFPVGFAYVDDKTMLPKRKDGSGVITNEIDYLDTWKAMESLVKQGFVRSIGISNFNAAQTERVLNNCEIKPVTNQVECNIDLNQKKLIEFSKQRDIVITAYCPLGRPNPSEKIPQFLFSDRMNSIAAKYNKTPAQVALRYTYQLGTVPIPKSVTKQRIKENMEIFDFELTDDDMNVLETLQQPRRIAEFLSVEKSHPFYPFNDEL